MGAQWERDDARLAEMRRLSLVSYLMSWTLFRVFPICPVPAALRAGRGCARGRTGPAAGGWPARAAARGRATARVSAHDACMCVLACGGARGAAAGGGGPRRYR